MKLPAVLIFALCLLETATADSGSGGSTERLPALIQQLGSRRYRAREQAFEQIGKMGRAALPALREARSHRDPEIRQRVDLLISRIEGREPQRLHVRRCLARLLTDNRLSNAQRIEALHLVCLGRPPTEKESRAFPEQMEQAKEGAAAREKLFDSLLYRSDFCKDVGLACQHIGQLRTEMQSAFAKQQLGGVLTFINSNKVQEEVAAAGKLIGESKALRSDEDRMKVMFLITVHRFPKENEKTTVLKWLKQTKSGWGDIQWALLNTKEFVDEVRQLAQGK